MSATNLENHNSIDAPNDPVATVRAFVDELPPKDGLTKAIEEGRQIATIVEPLGLPRELLAAVHLYPL